MQSMRRVIVVLFVVVVTVIEQILAASPTNFFVWGPRAGIIVRHLFLRFFNKADFDDKMYEEKGKKCSKSKDKAVKAKVKGPFQYKPTEGPKPCGEMVWLCNDQVYQTQESYKSSSCAKSTKTSDEVKKKIGDKNTKAARCKDFIPDPRCGRSIKKTSPVCRCR